MMTADAAARDSANVFQKDQLVSSKEISSPLTGAILSEVAGAQAALGVYAITVAYFNSFSSALRRFCRQHYLDKLIK
jgi:hypothetical protein